MDVIKAAFLIKDYCHEHLSGRNGGCKTCPLSNFRMWNESVRGCAVSRPANWTIRKEEEGAEMNGGYIPLVYYPRAKFERGTKGGARMNAESIIEELENI